MILDETILVPGASSLVSVTIPYEEKELQDEHMTQKNDMAGKIGRTAALDEEMTDSELEGIAAAGVIRGTEGNDLIYGKAGADEIHGGGGDDLIDGGMKDGADDVIYGGAGNDKYIWDPSGDGNDIFHGGYGEDSVQLELSETGQSSIQEAFESGYLKLTVEGYPDYVPEYDENGSMILPKGCSGTITGPDGETMSFTGLEKIGMLQTSEYAPY